MPCFEVSVKGVAIKNGKMLLAVSKKGNLVIPGGRKEPGETLEETLVREFKEELSLEVKPLKVFFAEVYEYPKGNEKVYIYYLVDIIGNNEPIPGAEIAKALWAGEEEIEKLDIAEDYKEFLKKLLKMARKNI